MKKIYIFIIIIFFILISKCFSDKIILNNGKEIGGKIVSQDDEKIYIEVGGSELGFLKSDVKEIINENISESETKVGDEFYESRQYKDALSKYLEIKKLDPNNQAIDGKIAKALKNYYLESVIPADKALDQKDFDKAITLYENLLNKEFNDTFYEEVIKAKLSEVYTAQSLEFIDKIRLVSATRAIQKAIEYNPNSSNAHLVLGTIILKSGKCSIAMEEFQLALDADPTNKEAAKYLAMYKNVKSPITKPEEIPKIILPKINEEIIQKQVATVSERKPIIKKEEKEIETIFGSDRREIALFLAGYNAGLVPVETYKGKVPYKETRNYIKRVFTYMEQPMKQTKYDDLIKSKSQKYNLDPVLIKAIVKAESDFNPNCVTDNWCGGARGLIQIIPEVWQDTINRLGVNWNYKRDVYDPEKNLEVGCHYLRWLQDNFVRKWMANDYEPYMPT